ncbi:MAG: PIG-L family deacetylase [Patescibacteria group bacterium]|nr:PIG-L family deacetylase [Patescibacteria group bacterium]MDE2588941.1 PIG-L family deacetylase [Patescibacteria group bacterium]
MQTIVGIFAHPDDEALGPSGTIATLAKENNVFLICVTNGDSASGHPDAKLAEIRQKELLGSADVLGVKGVYFLDFADGTLANNIYHKVAEKITEILDRLRPEQLITLEPHGVSGHLDHIAVSMIASYVFQHVSYAKELWYFCLSKEETDLIPNYFVYFPPGYTQDQIDKIVYVSSVWDQKIAAMKKHESQKKDVEAILFAANRLPKEEYFLIKKK